jgi:hypothetical protein
VKVDRIERPASTRPQRAGPAKAAASDFVWLRPLLADRLEPVQGVLLVAGLKPSAFQHRNPQARAEEFRSQHKPGRAGADDDKIEIEGLAAHVAQISQAHGRALSASSTAESD